MTEVAEGRERKEQAMNKTTAVGGGSIKRSVPSKRHSAPKVCTVTMDQVPESPLSGRTGIADALWAQIMALKAGAALKAEFESDAHASYVRGKLRAKAKDAKKFLSSSRSPDGKTRYFWLEKL